ncbi:hypothetical protein QQP08_008551 [Theobroma cacao]|nr:hypothetical protein QQP08_008551 [Theobroma cacao]
MQAEVFKSSRSPGLDIDTRDKIGLPILDSLSWISSDIVVDEAQLRNSDKPGTMRWHKKRRRSIVVLAPFLLGDQGEAITEAITELLSPVGLLLLPIIVLLTIRFLSLDRGSFICSIFSTGEPDSIHRVSDSPFGVTLFLVAPQTPGSSLPHTAFPSLTRHTQVVASYKYYKTHHWYLVVNIPDPEPSLVNVVRTILYMYVRKKWVKGWNSIPVDNLHRWGLLPR